MRRYHVNIDQRHDGLFVAKIASLTKAVGYGLDEGEALYELAKAVRARTVLPATS